MNRKKGLIFLGKQRHLVVQFHKTVSWQYPTIFKSVKRTPLTINIPVSQLVRRKIS